MTSKKREKTTKYYKHNKNQRDYVAITIIIISLESDVLLRVKKSKVGVYG
jgi:energy-coupling factor transporter transmembrane protein EcfT